jgi:hypothetical protein
MKTKITSKDEYQVGQRINFAAVSRCSGAAFQTKAIILDRQKNELLKDYGDYYEYTILYKDPDEN